MAQLIQAEHRDTEPGKSPRWRLIGVVRSALRYGLKDLSKDALAFSNLVEIPGDIDWPNVAPATSRVDAVLLPLLPAALALQPLDEKHAGRTLALSPRERSCRGSDSACRSPMTRGTYG